MKTHAPVGRRGSGNASNQKSKGHGADSRFGPERGTENGKVRKLQAQTVRRDPQKVPPPEGRPDSDQQEAEKEGLDGGEDGSATRRSIQITNDMGNGKLSRLSVGAVATAKARTMDNCGRD